MTQAHTRILILSSSYGAGHNQVTGAIEKSIVKHKPSCEVRSVDFFDFVSKPLNRLIRFSYFQSLKHWPAGYGLFYEITNDIRADSWFQRRLNTIGKRELSKDIQTFKPDAIICTYPTPAGVLSEMRRDGHIGIPVFTVVTDYTVHSQWIHPCVDHYLLGCEEIAIGMSDRSIARNRLTVTGIPIRSDFYQQPDQASARCRLGLPPDLPTVLIISGAFAKPGSVIKIIQAMSKLDQPCQIIVISGNNKRLHRKLDSVVAESSHPLQILGYVDDMVTLMCAADVVVTKAGGVTGSEVLACGRPMVIYPVIPGQEKANATYFKDNNTALLAKNLADLKVKVDSVLADTKLRANMSRAAFAISHIDAADRVANAVLDTCT